MLAPVGQMRDQAAVLTPIRAVDASGGEVTTYAESDPIFVAIRSLSTSEAIQFGQVNADISHVCFGHWHSLNQLTGQNRIRLLETGQDFDINGGPINDPKRAFTRLNLILRENG